MEDKKIIIIGSGIAGMAMGCYLQMNGYRSVIYEKGFTSGGLCTGWKRGDYYFDGCISWLVGSSSRNWFHKAWNELNIIQNMNFINDDDFAVVNLKDGSKFTLYSDVDKLEEEFLRVAPEDSERILSLTNSIREISAAELNLDKAPELFTREDFEAFKVKAVNYMKVMARWSKITIQDFAKEFKSEFVRKNYKRIFWFKHDTTIANFIATMGWHNIKSAGYPLESSTRFADIIKERYINLGGKIYYNSEVSEILVENDVAVGIKLKNGEVHNSNLIVSAADGYNTIFKMLKGKYVDEGIKYCYDNLKTNQPKIYIGLGVSKKLDEFPHYMSLELDNTIRTYDNKYVDNIYVKIYNHHTSFAPEGKTSVVVYTNTTYEYWEELRKNNMEKYNDEKLRIANEVIEVLDKHIDGIKSNIELIDVSTPCTVERYTGNRNGSWMGWSKEIESIENEKKLKRELPGLDGFYMVGHWSEIGGGLPSVVLQTRNLVQVICKNDEKVFTTTTL